MKSLEMFSLSGKVALVTGATHGLGMALATALAQAGAKLVINDIDQERLTTAKAEYKANGVDVHTYLFDVTKEDQVIAGIKKIKDEVGSVDILVNNAGIIKRIPAQDMSVEDFNAVINVDLVAPFIMSKAVIGDMIEKGSGKIINICSMMSEVGRDTVSAYAAAKGGLKMLTKNLATEWARYNVQVNGIGPGYFATSQTAAIRVEGHPFNDFILKRTPAARWGEPTDLGGAAVFLSSAASDFVSGHVLYVDGGILASLGKAMNED